MPQGLPRKIKLAFIAQALIGSIVITLGIGLAGLLVRNLVLEQRMQREADAFWAGHARDPAHPLPRTSTTDGYFIPTGAGNDALPEAARGTSRQGLNELPHDERVMLVDRREAGTFYLLYSSELIDEAIAFTGLASLLLSLLTMYLISWMTYRNTKRLVTPVNRLAAAVAHWDPRDPRAVAHSLDSLPQDMGSEVRQLSTALRGLAQRVGEFVQRERDFTRDASHELRTPLTVIRVATDLMLADPETPQRAQRSLARVQRAGRDMEAVIDAFLILAREAEIAPQSEEFPVREIVDHEVERVRPMLNGKDVELNVSDDGAPRLLAPPHVLSVMVGNLLSNAVRFTDAGRIDVHLTRDGIEIRDTGIGMSAETLNRAFDPFYRADFSGVEGKGMGLSIVRRLGERFGWPVQLSSVPGQGTLAVIRFSH
ncbi:HAMP domain-containing histidine kinase [Lysobacter sp. 5GHs7-4]|uniref:sensor histidine kinase n=1 Tax=Lysobacter sp. 5GHs7-4 TaxID=2904253 RepID=UPI001E3AEE1C|nr:HAMP domain-containing sensor histidine kinase [Lysobacter sp. 5GHs7-4]UHQ24250.1 HAMP domain-containing histidine kinase [Lysobacter sp. 5GHs7-4]